MYGNGAQRNHLDCGECQANTTAEERQGMRCGWLPRLPDNRGQVCVPHESLADPKCGTCPGYLVGLPEVGQAFTAHMWWDKGQLRAFAGDDQPSILLPFYVEQVAGAIAERDTEQEIERETKRKARAAQDEVSRG